MLICFLEYSFYLGLSSTTSQLGLNVITVVNYDKSLIYNSNLGWFGLSFAFPLYIIPIFYIKLSLLMTLTSSKLS